MPSATTTLFPPRQAIGPAERAAAIDCIDYYQSRGEDPPNGGVFHKRYADAIRAYFGVTHALPVSSGTAALYVAIRSLGLPAGSTIICSPITDPGCVSAVTMNGFKLKLSDSPVDSFSMDPNAVIGDLDATVSAVLFVHSTGHATDLAPLRKALDARNVKLVEDLSQAHGARIGNTLAGTTGDVSILSTMSRKAHVTGSNGGVILTNASSIYRASVIHADRGKDKLASDFEDRNPQRYQLPGLNFNLDEISCAIGCASLQRLDDTRRRRLQYVAAVTSEISRRNLPFRVFPFSEGDSPFIIPVRCPAIWSVAEKTRFATLVRDAGVPLNPHYGYFVASWDYGQHLGLRSAATPNALAAQGTHFCLYVNENYGAEEARFTGEKLTEVLAKFGADRAVR